MPAREALTTWCTWLARANARFLLPGPRHFDVLDDLLSGPARRAVRVTAARLAALAIEHQADLQSSDADFARCPGLRGHNRLAAGA